MNSKSPLVRPEQIEQAILLIRGQRVMLDRDLAALYGVNTGALNRAAKPHREIGFHIKEDSVPYGVKRK